MDFVIKWLPNWFANIVFKLFRNKLVNTFTASWRVSEHSLWKAEKLLRKWFKISVFKILGLLIIATALGVVAAFLGAIHGDTFCDDCGNGICRGIENNKNVPNRGNCLRYFTCINQVPHPDVCPSGQWFNPEIRRCDNLTNGQCRPSDQFECPPDGIHFFPHETYCHKYYMCFAGVPILSSCAEGLYFDREILKCNFPEYAECKHDICPPTNDPTNITFVASRVDCEKYGGG